MGPLYSCRSILVDPDTRQPDLIQGNRDPGLTACMDLSRARQNEGLVHQQTEYKDGCLRKAHSKLLPLTVVISIAVPAAT